MIVYHGSNIIVDKPSILFSRENLDFGKGFYVTEIEEQAISWARRYMKEKGKSYVSKYNLQDKVYDECNVLKFENYSEGWLDYIVKCRNGYIDNEHDMILGCVANDRVFNTCELFFKKLIDKKTAIERLKYEQNNNQICIKKQSLIEKYLVFEGSKEYVGR